MDLKGEVRVRKKPKKDSFVFATILTTVLLIGGLFFPKEISFFLKEKHSATKMGNSTHTRNIDMTKYERSRHNYYINLYITILLVNIGIICIMFLINYNIITPALFYIIIFRN